MDDIIWIMRMDTDSRTARAAAVLGESSRRILEPFESALIAHLDRKEDVLTLVALGDTTTIIAFTADRLLAARSTSNAEINVRPLSRPIEIEQIGHNAQRPTIVMRGAGGTELRLTTSPSGLRTISRALSEKRPPISGRPLQSLSRSSVFDAASRLASKCLASFSELASWVENYESREASSDGSRRVHQAPLGTWRWHKSPKTWREAEHLAAAHMRHVGYQQVWLTPGGRDGGLDVVALSAAAQVKYYTSSSVGSPAIQMFLGAALNYPDKLFYSTSYTSPAINVANRHDVALYKIGFQGQVVPINARAQTISSGSPAGTAGRKSRLSRDKHIERCTRWSEQIFNTIETKMFSNSDTLARKDSLQRKQARRLTLAALETLNQANHPLYRDKRRDRMVAASENDLRAAAKLVGARLT